VCNKTFESGRLQIHIRTIHGLEPSLYYTKYIHQPEIVKCLFCEKPTKFLNLQRGFSRTCGSRSCASKLINQEHKEKQIEGCKQRNKEWKTTLIDGKTKQQLIIEKGKEKRKEKQEETSIKISKSLKTKDENGLTNSQKFFLKKYNVTNPMYLDSTINKLKDTFRKEHNCGWITQSPLIKEKIRKTLIDRFGVDNYAKTQMHKDIVVIRYRDEVLKRIEKYFEENNLILLSDASHYGNEKTLLKYQCKKCNNIYEKCWNDIQSWWSCRVCNPNISTSSYENTISEFLTSNNIQHYRRHRFLSKEGKIIEVDFLIPEKKLAVEFDGLYWHSNKHQLNDNYHLQKTEICSEQGIRLIHIFEDELVEKKQIVFSRLSYYLGLIKNRISARDCKIITLESSIKDKFLKENHIQSNDISSINLGLIYDNDIVSVMTFSRGNISKGSKPKEGIWELSRFCSKINYIVVGGVTKLFSYFIKNYPWQIIFTYSDRRWNTGKVYETLGFKLDSIIRPNYWYIDLRKSLKRYHRFKFRKSELKIFSNYRDDLTEKQIMELEGYFWIYDCGNLKYIMKNCV